MFIRLIDIVSIKLLLNTGDKPSKQKKLYDICIMLDQRRRRHWDDVLQMLYKCFLFAGKKLRRKNIVITHKIKIYYWINSQQTRHVDPVCQEGSVISFISQSSGVSPGPV